MDDYRKYMNDYTNELLLIAKVIEKTSRRSDLTASKDMWEKYTYEHDCESAYNKIDEIEKELKLINDYMERVPDIQHKWDYLNKLGEDK